jgi:hypothetical protein
VTPIFEPTGPAASGKAASRRSARVAPTCKPRHPRYPHVPAVLSTVFHCFSLDSNSCLPTLARPSLYLLDRKRKTVANEFHSFSAFVPPAFSFGIFDTPDHWHSLFCRHGAWCLRSLSSQSRRALRLVSSVFSPAFPFSSRALESRLWNRCPRFLFWCRTLPVPLSPPCTFPLLSLYSTASSHSLPKVGYHPHVRGR